MKLLFVYNADGAFTALIGDTLRKLVSPDTYPCNLCRITYPLISMDGQWKKFIDSLPHQVLFLHRDQFRKQYPSQKDVHLPALFRQDPSGIHLLIPYNEINKARSLPELIKMMERSLPKQN